MKKAERLCERQPNFDRRASPVAIRGANGSAITLDNRAGDGQTQAHVLPPAAIVWTVAEEPIEDALDVSLEGNPGPRSSTVTMHVAAVGGHRHVDDGPGGAKLAALSSRFSKTWARRSEDART